MYQRIDAAPVTPEPAPWKRVDHAVGGLTDIGFADDTDLLVTLSGQGRGIYDCTSGERLERDVSSLSSAVRRLQLKAKQDERVADKFQKLLNRIQR